MASNLTLQAVGIPAHIAAGGLARAAGMLDRARAQYLAALSIDPFQPVALKALAELSRQTTPGLLEQIRGAQQRYGAHDLSARILHFAAAKCCDDLGLTGEAWSNLIAGNARERAHLAYDWRTDAATMHSLGKAFREPLAPSPVRGTGAFTSEHGIFIVGLPRCGSTLLEQALSAHSEIAALGECPAMPDACTMLAAPDEPGAPMRWGQVSPAALAAEYLWRAGLNLVRAGYWVDKQLLNFCYVPLILKAFPSAQIVHLTRHPLAHAFALFRVRFQGGWQFSYSLDDIGRFMAGYLHLMAQWDLIAPGRILTVRHEDLTSSFPATVDRVLAFAGLKPQSACYRPQEARRAVSTMSAVQVREPVQSDKAESWRAYEWYLEPVRRALTEGFYSIPSSG